MPVPSSLQQQRLAATAVALCGAMWGVYWVPLRWIDGQGVGAATTSLLYSLVAIAATLPWMRRASDWHDFPRQSISGLLLGTAFALYTVSLLMTGVVNAILLFYLTPVWSALGEWLIYRRTLSLRRGLAIVMGFVGVGFILGVDGGLPLPRNAGDLVALASGMVWAAGTLRSSAFPSARVAVPAMSFAMGGAVSSAVIMAVALWFGHAAAATGNLTATLPWIVLAALIIFVPPNALVMWAAQRLDSGRVGILLMTEAMMGAISAALFSGEAFGTAQVIGTVLVVGAGLLEVLGRRDG
jgi:drug/metabolite transporter (DMT)-like permease